MNLMSLLNDSPNGLLLEILDGIGLEPDAVNLTPVTENSNLNEVIKISSGDRAWFVKSAVEIPFGYVRVPPERNRFEAQALQLANRIDTNIVTPQCLYINETHNFFVMSAVATKPKMLANNSPSDFSTVFAHLNDLAGWLRRFHGLADLFNRPIEQSKLLSGLVYQHILTQGVKTVFPDQWQDVIATCSENSTCLVHSDLWGKNLLLTDSGRLGIVDFEGVMFGDNAADIAAIFCTLLFCSLENITLMEKWGTFCRLFIQTYSNTDHAIELSDGFYRRLAFQMALLLTHRTHGTFPYKLTNSNKDYVTRAATNLIELRSFSLSNVVDSVFSALEETSTECA